MSSRGIRNNNWGNIRHGNNWRGEVKGADGGFESFSNPIWGLRAMIKVTRSYVNRRGVVTVRDFVYRYAPTVDNNPHNEAYIKHIEKYVESEICPYDRSYMEGFIKAVCEFENGTNEIDKVWNTWIFDMAYFLAK